MASTDTQEPGTIVTFYSYKGGTGRTMALANYACYLAQQLSLVGKRILIIDWDLEAPGLHRFFADRASFPAGEGPKGIIDYFVDLRSALEKDKDLYFRLTGSDSTGRLDQLTTLDAYTIRDVFTASGTVDLIRAGRYGPRFAETVSSFRWVDFFDAYSLIFQTFRELITSHYAYCLIDSRTGLTDTSGICTMLMPEKLVAVFTPNLQSLEGVIDLLESSLSYRSASNDFRPLAIFPLPSRIENVQKLQEHWRERYQKAFESLFRHDDAQKRHDLTSYFNRVLLPHKADYSFGEAMAIVEEKFSESGSLRKAYETFFEILTASELPWEPPELRVEVEEPTLRRRKIILIHGAGQEWSDIKQGLEPHFFCISLQYRGYEGLFGILDLIIHPAALAVIAMTVLAQQVEVIRLGTSVLVAILTAGIGLAVALMRRRKTLLAAKAELDSHLVGWARPHVIAQGVGTYILGKLMTLWGDVVFSKIVLVGSLLPRNFPWKRLVGRYVTVRNEIMGTGLRSVATQLLIGMLPGLGSSGRKGFRSQNSEVHTFTDPWTECETCRHNQKTDTNAPRSVVHNIIYPLGHSDLLNRSHVERFWLPFLWNSSPDEFWQFVELCSKLSRSDAQHDYQGLNALERELLDREWSWTNGTLRASLVSLLRTLAYDRKLSPRASKEAIGRATRNLYLMVEKAPTGHDPRSALLLAVEAAIPQVWGDPL